MKNTVAATAIALIALAAPAFAQTAPSGDGVTISSPASEQVTRDVNGFRIVEKNAHSPRVQKIFDEIRAEKGTSTTR